MSKEFQPLESLMNKYFKFNPLITKCLSQLVLCMVELKTVNLSTICQVMVSSAKVSSSYRRLQRLIAFELIPQKSLAQLIVATKGLNDEKVWKLTMDRTNWKFGKIHVNILYLWVCCNNVASPFFLISSP